MNQVWMGPVLQELTYTKRDRQKAQRYFNIISKYYVLRDEEVMMKEQEEGTSTPLGVRGGYVKVLYSAQHMDGRPRINIWFMNKETRVWEQSLG